MRSGGLNVKLDALRRAPLFEGLTKKELEDGARLVREAVPPTPQYSWPLLNERATRLVGQSYILGEPIVGGNGRIRVGDTTWRLTGPDLPSGTRVRIVGHDGSVLRADRAEG